MREVLKYNNHTGSINICFNDEILYGKILNTGDLVVYSGQTISELRRNFELAANEYENWTGAHRP